ncbi:jg19565 [Pararge aegeria aegeria]|uniref:Jg19565 protein n=1 Tax=Pararge aegeria aegeria TaxID=348720 RepID=A0A8S4RDM3_9NEOP|nr:jg19565 [Pararge aegeria aegeria]
MPAKTLDDFTRTLNIKSVGNFNIIEIGAPLFRLFEGHLLGFWNVYGWSSKHSEEESGVQQADSLRANNGPVRRRRRCEGHDLPNGNVPPCAHHSQAMVPFTGTQQCCLETATMLCSSVGCV